MEVVAKENFARVCVQIDTTKPRFYNDDGAIGEIRDGRVLYMKTWKKFASHVDKSTTSWISRPPHK